jgi:hypothetical protein
MTQQEVLQVGSRLYKHLGSPAGRAAIYPKRDDEGNWYLLVKADADLALVEPPAEFEGVPVRYQGGIRWPSRAEIAADLPDQYTDGSQGAASCGQCDWTGLELDVPPVAWGEGEESTCPSCGAESVYLSDPGESNA